MRKLVYMLFGSHLYGTATAQSDLDYKGIYLPSHRDVYLSNVKKTINKSTGDNNSRNTAGDVDEELFSLQQFIKLAVEGQTVALDMLHASDDKLVMFSPEWQYIVDNRERLYTKKLDAFVGYCRKQAAKYGTKGSRLDAAQSVVDILSEYDPKTRLSELWSLLPTGDHIHFIKPSDTNKHRYSTYQVCGKKFTETAPAKMVIESLTTFIKKYGHRSVLARQNKGVDWKAISHALRAAFQLEQLYTENTITFPLAQSKYLTQVKQGQLHYNDVSPVLEAIIERVELLSDKSEFPASVDTCFWEDFIVNVYEGRL